ncbi:unnamed protein product [Auanema sp. JU1783]|nr:unnamed protein product [Auanema sp. JU1783]
MNSISWRTICESSINYDEPILAISYFEKLISLWQTHCQSINRRLAGSIPVTVESDDYKNVLSKLDKALILELRENGIDLIVRKLIPRTDIFSANCYEVSYDDNKTETYSHIAYSIRLDPPTADVKHPHIPHPYKITIKELSESSLRLNLSVPNHCTDESVKWLVDTAYPRLKKWLDSLKLDKESTNSNRLLSAENYWFTYKKMKDERGKDIVKNWTEKTQAEKFVYEDCGIASYILETWKRLGSSPRLFADLGCGNGLLVHLLNKEGHNGIGLDVRKRKIWSEQFSEADLRISTIDPTLPDTGVPDEVDYLIGNHSDELTPWIPIMAAKKRCGFILIPCCPFDFYGKYRSRVGDTGSSYSSFLKFVEEVCSTLGYIVEEDRLKIPSTKRICYICSIPPNGLPENVDEIISSLIKPRDQEQTSFSKRDSHEEVRNCSNIDEATRNRLVNLIFEKLLSESDERVNGWRCGAKLPLNVLIQCISKEDRAIMKQQDGGLQTFLKNQHQTFMVIGGIVMIRDWRVIKKAPVKKSVPTTPCWMLENHPDGCPYGTECRFKH